MIKYKRHLKPLARELRRAENLAEVLLWNQLKNDKLGSHFLRQKPIGNYIVDFYCHRLSLVIEIDGGVHNARIDEDAQRQGALELIGMRVIRFTDIDVKTNLAGVIESIKAEILRPSATSFTKGGI